MSASRQTIVPAHDCMTNGALAASRLETARTLLERLALPAAAKDDAAKTLAGVAETLDALSDRLTDAVGAPATGEVVPWPSLKPTVRV